MSKNPSAPGNPSRFAGPARFIRDLPIWTKLGLIMIVPTIATIVVGTAGLLDQVEQASAAERARALTVLSGDAGGLVHTLQSERNAAVMLLASPEAALEAATANYGAQQEATQAAITRYQATRTTIAEIPTDFSDLLDRIQNQLGQLTPLRQQVLALNQVSLSVAEDRYEELISDLLAIRTFSAQLTGDSSLTDRIQAASAVADQKEFLAREGVIIGKSLASGEYPTSDRDAYALVSQNARQAETRFRAVATIGQIDIYERTVTGAILRDVLQLEGSLDSLRPDQRPGDVIDPAEWQRATLGRADLLYQVEMALNGEALEAAEAVGAAVQRRVLVETGILLLTLLIGVLFAWLVARSMARSLRDLRQGALAVAQFGLPQAVSRLRDPAVSASLSPAGVALQIAEPLPVRSNDEFGQVTEAFNAVHLEAVRTAAEQAALRASVATMFVNLARRSQILVDRLIGHLDRLERGEQDPDRLSELFQLDHLATRMRRNDENLLVLAGADSTRIQREPAALMDVMRAAQSEVEQYTRVEFLVVDHDIEIAAHAVNDLVHLVAELFDNATSFSPPDTAIRVEARRIGERAVLRVEDRGIGMTADQYAELNDRLARPPQVDVAVSRMMGLVVVARLAARHGVTVELQPAPQRGTIADVVLPSGVLVPRALAGRTHAPTGFPAVWGEDPAQVTAGPRSPFGPPLALESGSASGPPPSFGGPQPAYGGAPYAGAPAFGGQPSYDTSYGAPPSASPPGVEPAPAPLYGTQPPAFGSPPPAYGTPTPAFGSPPPAFGTPPPAFATPPPGFSAPPPAYEPPPTQAPVYGAATGSAAVGGAAVGGAAVGGAAVGGAAAAAAAAGLAGGLGAALTSAGAIPPVGGGNGRGRVPAWYDLTGASGPTHGPATTPGGLEPLPQRRPGGWGDPEPEGPPAPRSGGAGGWGEPPTGYGGVGYGVPAPSAAPVPPPASRPPMWPPTGDDSRAGVPGPTSSNDMTVELPIFSELESAWFASGTGRDGPRPSAWPPEPSSAAPAAPAGPSVGAGSWSGGVDAPRRPAEDVSWRTIADDGWRAAEAAASPQDGGLTDNGLPRRVPMAQLVPGAVESAVGGSDRRTPDSVRGLLSAYHRGVQRGREAHGAAGTDSYPSGKEQEA